MTLGPKMALSKIVALLCIFSLGCAVQQDESSKADKTTISKKMEELKNLMETEIQPILTSVHAANNDLNAVIQDINLKKQSFDLYRQQLSANLASLPSHCLTNEVLEHSLALHKWNWEHCGDFADDCLNAAKLIFNGSAIAFHIGMTAADVVTSVIHCPSVNLVYSVKCFTKNIDEVRGLIDYTKTEAVPLIRNVVLLSKHLPVSFKECTGKAVQTHTMLLDSLAQAQCF